jgi:hypothetical protein
VEQTWSSQVLYFGKQSIEVLLKGKKGENGRKVIYFIFFR